MRRGYSRTFSLIMQAFFAFLVLCGIDGLIWLGLRYTRPPAPDFEIVALYLILFGCLVGFGIAGIIHMRRKDSQLWGDKYEKWRRGVLANTPGANICQGVGWFATGCLASWLTYSHAKDWGELSHLPLGVLLFGAVQAMYGGCQLIGRLIRIPSNSEQIEPSAEFTDWPDAD